MQNDESNGIYFWRIIFTLMIMVFHYNNYFPIFINKRLGWYIAVEFFFIVSGYLIAKQVEINPHRYKSAICFTRHRLHQIYPAYFISFLITFLVGIYVGREYSFTSVLERLLDVFMEMLALQGIGLNRGWDYINTTTWYISILLIVGHFYYYLLRHHYKFFTEFLLPLIVVICYSYLYRNIRCLDAVIQTEGFYLNYAMMRGMADIALGIYAYRLSKYIKEGVLIKRQLLVIKGLGICGFVFVISLSCVFSYSIADYAYLFILFFSVATGFLPREYKVPVIVKKLSGLTFEMYLLHHLYRAIVFPCLFNASDMNMSGKLMLLVVYVIVDFISALILRLFVKKWYSKTLKE